MALGQFCLKVLNERNSIGAFDEFWQKVSSMNSLQWKITKILFIKHYLTNSLIDEPFFSVSLEWKKQHRWVWWILTKSKFDELTSMENNKKYFLFNTNWRAHNSMNPTLPFGFWPFCLKVLSETNSIGEFDECWQKVSSMNSLQWKITKNYEKYNLTNSLIDEPQYYLLTFGHFCLKVLKERNSIVECDEFWQKSKFDKLTSIENY